MRAGVGALLVLVATLVTAAALAQDEPSQGMTTAELNGAMAGLRSNDAAARAAAADLIGARGYAYRARAVPVLRVVARNDQTWSVRAAAVRALGRLGARRALPEIAKALGDPRSELRTVAAAALWRVPDPVVTPALVSHLQTDTDPVVRQWCAVALGATMDRRATEPLIAALRDASSPVRLDAVRSLARRADPAGLDGIKAFAARQDLNLDERQEALRALLALATDGDAKVDLLAPHVADPNPAMRSFVVELLGETGSQRALALLRRRLPRERTPRLRRAIQAAIAHLQAAPRSRDGARAVPATGDTSVARTTPRQD